MKRFGWSPFVLSALAVFAVAVVMWPAMCEANGIRNPPAGAAALSMDGGKSTLVDDPSVISCNPANLAEIKEPSLMIAMNAIAGKAGYDHRILAGLSTKNSIALLPDMFAALPIGEGRYVLGLGVNTPFGQSAEWEDNFLFPYFSELGVVNVNPTIAGRLAKGISIGLGVDLYMSTIEQKALVPALGFGEVKLSGSGSGLGANAAVTWRPTGRQQVALTCRSGFDVEYDGDTEISSPCRCRSLWPRRATLTPG